MNILFVSHLTNSRSQGPNYSVPAQVLAQTKYDNIHWLNLTNSYQEHWSETGVYHSINEYNSLSISELPSPFDKPDLVIFQGFYYYNNYKLAMHLKDNNIPYIIIPRGELTKDAQKIKCVKKYLGNLVMFKRFAKKALAIQYLTNREHLDSGSKWNESPIIIPNGITTKENTKKWNNSERIRGVYIGRMAPFHKGHDLLIKACVELREKFGKNNCVIVFYGPERFGFKAQLQKDISDNNLEEILVVKDGVFGKEKEEVLLKSDFFIMTSRFEGHPMGLIEALSYGLPCLVTVGTNMAEEVSKANAGWTADNNVESIKKALSLMLSQRDSFEIKGNNAIALSRNYNWDVLAQVAHAKYKQLLQTV